MISLNLLDKSNGSGQIKLVSATHSAQSTAIMRVMSSVGNPTDVSTITMVTSPACGIPAAPILAAVAVMLVNTWEVNMIKRNKPYVI